MSELNAEGLEGLGNPRFLELLEEERRVHLTKAAGYSGQDNPDTWANFREASAWGLTPLQGCLVRLGDKYRRVQNLMRNPDNDRVGESIKDTLMDLSNYAKIAICLLEEEEAVAKATGRKQGDGKWPPLDDHGKSVGAKAFREILDAGRPE